MKIPLEWLKQYVTIRLSPEAVANKLTMAGLEVIAVEGTGAQSVFEVEVTPNRPDWLSIIGVARELAAVTGQSLKLPWGKRASARREGGRARAFNIRVEDRKGCPRYVGRLLEEVRVGPSPEWMVRRLEAVGLRSINNVVDVTNYCLLETGQPLHAFDADVLEGQRLIVRRATPGERIVTLDGQSLELSGDALVIADAGSPVALAGVMGGRESQVTSSTTRVLLESAQFDPRLIRRTSRRFSLRTESSYRFERGIDPAGVETASARAATLIEELAGARQHGAAIVVGAAPTSRKPIRLQASRVSACAGAEISAASTKRFLTELGARCVSRGKGSWDVTPPSWRPDITQEADLFEEVIRLFGYDRIPSELPDARIAPVETSQDLWFDRFRSIRRWLTAAGFDEAVTFSLTSRANQQLFHDEAEVMALVNPLSQEQEALRTSLLYGIVKAAAWNVKHGAESVRLFEVGAAYRAGAGHAPEALGRQQVGLAVSGTMLQSWRHGRRSLDFFDLKGALELLEARFRCAPIEVSTTQHKGLSAGGCWSLLQAGRPVGVMGACDAAVLSTLEVRQPILAMVVDVEAVWKTSSSQLQYVVPPRVPPVRRDLALIVKESVSSGDVLAAIRASAGPLVSGARLFDVYRGKQIPPGTKSLAYTLELSDGDRTLEGEDIEACVVRVTQALTASFGATVRAHA